VTAFLASKFTNWLGLVRECLYCVV
jgi:hypothetical protein